MFDDLLASAALGAATGIASIPHCGLMCGPLSAAVCAQSRRPHAALRYQAGRVAGYGLAGLLAGRFGMALATALPQPVGAWLLPAATLLSCVLLAVRFWPRRARPTLHPLRPPNRLPVYRPETTAAHRGPWLGRLLALVPRDPALVGALTSLLPCGALAAALLLSAGTGPGGAGAALMAGFALTSGLATAVPSSAAPFLAKVRGTWPRRTLAVALLAVALLAAGPALRASLNTPLGETHRPCHASGAQR